jgi:hypothetical protein
MKKIFFAVALFTAIHATAQSDNNQQADAILHIWETQEKDGKMQILNSGDLAVRDGALYMRVYKGIPMFGKKVKWNLAE